MISDTNFFLDEDEMDGWLFEETKLDDLVILKKIMKFNYVERCVVISTS